MGPSGPLVTAMYNIGLGDTIAYDVAPDFYPARAGV